MKVVSVYWFRQRQFTLCLKMFKLFVFLFVSGRLFHKEGPTYDKIFCFTLVLRKMRLSFAKLFLESFLQNHCVHCVYICKCRAATFKSRFLQSICFIEQLSMVISLLKIKTFSFMITI